jgi:sulfonate transport system permease protein
MPTPTRTDAERFTRPPHSDAAGPSDPAASETAARSDAAAPGDAATPSDAASPNGAASRTAAASSTAAAAPWRRRFPTAALLRWLSPLALLGVWQLLSATGVLSPKDLAAPSTILVAAWDLIQNGQLPDALAVSLRRAALGLVVGVSAATVLGTIAGLSQAGDVVVDPPMQMLRTLPLFGLIPLFILWFGIGETPKVLLVALGVVIPLYLNLVAALRGIDPELYEVADSLRLTRAERVRHILLPGALPGALVGLRQSLGVAWLALVVAEQVNAGSGLGYMINNARDFLQTDVVVVGLLTYAVLGLLTDALVRVLERRALRWRAAR